MRKGQGAMEYLMTYGWALLVIVIVGAALFALGVLNPATYQQRRCNGFQYITYIDQTASATNFTLHGRNGVNDINITKITVGGRPTTVNNASGTVTVDGARIDPDGGTFIAQGKEFTVESGVASIASGAYDDLSVTITYSVKNGIAGNTDTATCVGSVA